MTLTEVVAMVREKGGGFRSPTGKEPSFVWTIDRQGSGIIGGKGPGHTMRIAFHPTGDEIVLTDYEWVRPEESA
jgi:hypothetical protein